MCPVNEPDGSRCLIRVSGCLHFMIFLTWSGDSSQQYLVLLLFECPYSCPRVRALSVFQVKAWVIQSERQEGMAVAYRKFVVIRKNTFEAENGGFNSESFQQREKGNSPHFDSRNVMLPPHSVASEKSLQFDPLHLCFIFIFLNMGLFRTKKFFLVWSFANLSYHCFCQPPCIKKFLAFKGDRGLQGKDCL